MRSIIKAGLIFLVLAGSIPAASPIAAAEEKDGEGGPVNRAPTCAEKEEYIQTMNALSNPSNKIAVANWYISGECFDPDYAKAAKNYLFAAEKDYNRAFPLLGYFYANGLGVVRDMEEARYWFKRFALNTIYMDLDQNKRLEHAQEVLGKREMPKELKEELAWIGKVVAADAREKYRIALKLRDGDGLPMDRDAAYSLLLKASTKGLPEAYYEIGRGLLAREYIQVASHRDHTMSMALSYIRWAARDRYVPAEKFLGLYYADGSDMEPEYFWSYILLLRAREGGAEGIEETLSRVENELSEKKKKLARRRAKHDTRSIPVKKKPSPERMRKLRKWMDEELNIKRKDEVER